jgi:hypothetical protein
MLNFLVAILSATYENMKSSGVFKYKVNLYKYCEKYMIAFANPAYGQLILLSPPFSLFSSILLIFVFFEPILAMVSKWLAYWIFWVENLVMISVFSLYEFLLVPIVYFKTHYNIITCSNGLFKTIFKCFVWMLSGIIFNFFLACRDIYYLIKILSMH